MFKSLINNVFALAVPEKKYYINDPSTPSLSERPIVPPRPVGLQFTINQPMDVASINCRITITRALNAFQAAIAKIDKPLQQWQNKSSLLVYPKKAKQRLNARYTRKELMFFYNKNPTSKKMIYLCDSADIVAHELGHAILDAIKPELWTMQGFEIWGFHEAFADIQAIITILQSEQALNYILEETNGSLGVSNVASRLGEELGKAVSEKNYLRDAAIPYKYVNPTTLPSNKGEDLSSECHSFSRVFVSAWYAILVAIYDLEKQTTNALEAFKKARDAAYYHLIRAVKSAPVTPDYYKSIAKNMIVSDQMTQNVYESLMTDVFETWGIVVPEVKALSNVTWNDFKHSTLDKSDHVVKLNGYITIGKKKTKSIRLSEQLVSAQSGDNPLFDLVIDVPYDEFYHFDKSGYLLDSTTPDENLVLENAAKCLGMIQAFGWGEDHLWNVKNDCLERNYFD